VRLLFVKFSCISGVYGFRGVTQPMLLLRDVGQVETLLGPFGDSFNLDAR
jgi:hypothetical protein